MDAAQILFALKLVESAACLALVGLGTRGLALQWIGRPWWPQAPFGCAVFAASLVVFGVWQLLVEWM